MTTPTEILNVACEVDPDLAFERACMGDTHMIVTYKPIGLVERINNASPHTFVRLVNNMPVSMAHTFLATMIARGSVD